MPDNPLQKTDLSLSAPAFLRTESAARCRAPSQKGRGRGIASASAVADRQWTEGAIVPADRTFAQKQEEQEAAEAVARNRTRGSGHEGRRSRQDAGGRGDSHSAEAGKNVVSPPTAHRKFRPCTRTAGGPPRRAAGLTARSSVCVRPPAPHPKPDEKRPSVRTVFGKPQANREFTGRQPQREYAPPGPCGCAIFAARPLAAAPVSSDPTPLPLFGHSETPRRLGLVGTSSGHRADTSRAVRIAAHAERGG